MKKNGRMRTHSTAVLRGLFIGALMIALMIGLGGVALAADPDVVLDGSNPIPPTDFSYSNGCFNYLGFDYGGQITLVNNAKLVVLTADQLNMTNDIILESGAALEVYSAGALTIGSGYALHLEGSGQFNNYGSFTGKIQAKDTAKIVNGENGVMTIGDIQLYGAAYMLNKNTAAGSVTASDYGFDPSTACAIISASAIAKFADLRTLDLACDVQGAPGYKLYVTSGTPYTVANLPIGAMYGADGGLYWYRDADYMTQVTEVPAPLSYTNLYGTTQAPRTYSFKGEGVSDDGVASAYVGPFIDANLSDVTGKVYYGEQLVESELDVTANDTYFTVAWEETDSSYTITAKRSTEGLAGDDPCVIFKQNEAEVARLKIDAIDTTPILKMQIVDAQNKIVTAVPKNYEGALTAALSWRARVPGLGMPNEAQEAQLGYGYWTGVPTWNGDNNLLNVINFTDGYRKMHFTVLPGVVGTQRIVDGAYYNATIKIGGDAQATLNVYDAGTEYVLASGEEQANRLVVNLDHSGTTTAEVALMDGASPVAITGVTYAGGEEPGDEPIWTLNQDGTITLDCDLAKTGLQYGTFTYKIGCAGEADAATLVVVVVRSAPALRSLSYEVGAEFDMSLNPDGFYAEAQYYPAYDEDGVLAKDVEFKWTTTADAVFKPAKSGFQKDAKRMIMAFVAPGTDRFNCEIRHGDGADSMVGTDEITVTQSIVKSQPVIEGDVNLTIAVGSGASKAARFTMKEWTAHEGATDFPISLRILPQINGRPQTLSLDHKVIDADTYSENFELTAYWTREEANDCYGLSVYYDLGLLEIGKPYPLYVKMGSNASGTLVGNEYNEPVENARIGTLTLVSGGSGGGSGLAQPVLSGDNRLSGQVGQMWNGRTVKANLLGAQFAAQGEMIVSVKLGDLTRAVTVKDNGDLAVEFAAEDLNNLAAGEYPITASTEADSLNSAASAIIGTLTVNATNAPDPVIGKVSMPRKFKATVGFRYPLIKLTQGNVMPVFEKLISGKPKIATIEKDGTLTAHKTGRTTITVKVDGKVSKCVVSVVKNQFGWKKAVKGKKGTITLSTGRLKYMKDTLHLDVWVSNRTGKRLVDINGLKYELLDRDGQVLISVPFALMRKVPAGKAVHQCLSVTEEMLHGVADKSFDLACGALTARIIGWEDAVYTGKAVFEGEGEGAIEDADEAYAPDGPDFEAEPDDGLSELEA